MFNAFKKLLAKSSAVAADDGKATTLAIASLLVEAARADDVYSNEERRLIEELLIDKFGVAKVEASGVVDQAEMKQADAVDLFTFVREAKRLAYDDKVRLIESLWRVVLSDGKKDAWEDMLVRRVCGLLHVEDVDSGLARRRVEQERGT
jgi:uncharacterized tellurite resistance protein B-like protein